MSFDPITYAAANAAKLPLGAIVDGIAGNVPNGDWVHLDGTLISKAAYPQAANILGETILFNATPTEAITPLTLAAGVTNLSNGKSLAIGDNFIIAPNQISANINTYRFWRSADAGATWMAVNLTLPQNGSSVDVQHLEWFGAGRVMLVLSALLGSTYYLYATYSSDYGQNWSTPVQIASSTYFILRCDLSCDINLTSDGTGLYWFGVYAQTSSDSNTRYYEIYALNPATNTSSSKLSVMSGSSSEYCRVFGGSGSGVVHYRYSSTMYKATLTGNTWSSSTASGFVTVISHNYVLTCPVRTASGDYYIDNYVLYKLPTNWTGVSTSKGTATSNKLYHLLSNTVQITQTDTLVRFDLTTGDVAPVAGMNSGRESISNRYGHTSNIESFLPIYARTPNNAWVTTLNVGRGVLRSAGAMSNFFGNISKSADSGRFAVFSVGAFAWTDHTVIKTVDIVGTAPNFSMSVKTYSQANDYSQYLHLPYLPGLRCKLR